MARPSTKLGAFLLGGVMLLPAALPEIVPPRGQEALAAEATPSEELTPRQRWEALTPEQRQQLKRRYERLQNLDEDERKELERRAGKLREIETRVLSQLSPEARQRLEAKAPERRRELLEEMVVEAMRSRGREIEAQLPDAVRQELTNASPAERRVRWTRFKRETRERISLVVVEDTARALGHSQEDIDRFMRLPIEQRMKKVLELRKRFTAEQIARSGLPPGLTPERWKQLDRLAPREYFAAVMRMRDEGVFGSRPIGGRPLPKLPEETRRLVQDVTRELRPDPQEHLELAHLPAEKRRSEISRRRRERVMKLVRERNLLDEKQLAALEAMGNEEFFLHARRIVRDLHRGRAPELRQWKPDRPRNGREEPRGRGERRNGGPRKGRGN